MGKRCVIIAGAPEFGSYEPLEGDFVIAADKGYEHAKNIGLVPDILMGDFDSLTGLLPHHIKIIRSPAVKDDTDTMLAVKKGFELGFDNFLILGALGGRLDHQTANLAACAYVAEKGGLCELRGKRDKVFAIKNRAIEVAKEEGCYISVFSYTDRARGVTVNGLRYSLENAELENTFPIGVSNEFFHDNAHIEVKEGILLIIISPAI